MDNRDGIAGSAISVGHRETLTRTPVFAQVAELLYYFLIGNGLPFIMNT